MKDMERLVYMFRDAIDRAKDAGAFLEIKGNDRFRRFPNGCCDDASDLLAQYLLENGIGTYSVSGTYRDDSPENTQSHEWLLTDDQTVVIDITGDQFRYNPIFFNYNNPVYIGTEDDFHVLFEDRVYRKNNGIEFLGSGCQSRLNGLYRRIIQYIREGRT